MKNISFFTHLHVCLFEKWVGHAAGTERTEESTQVHGFRQILRGKLGVARSL